MLTKNDMVLIRGVFTEVLTGETPAIVDGVIQKTVPGMIEANNHVLKREIRDEVHSLIKASEAGLIRRMDAMEERLIQRMDSGFESMNELIDDGILPDIGQHGREILLIKSHLKLA
jgi:hypothetical protein